MTALLTVPAEIIDCHARSWSMDCGYGAYVDLMKRYPLVTDAFLQLKPGYQKACLTPSLLRIAEDGCPSNPAPLLLQPVFIQALQMQVTMCYFLQSCHLCGVKWAPGWSWLLRAFKLLEFRIL